MLSGDFAPAFARKHALKDAELAAQASGTKLPLTDTLLPRWRRAAAKHADDDLAADGASQSPGSGDCLSPRWRRAWVRGESSHGRP